MLGRDQNLLHLEFIYTKMSSGFIFQRDIFSEESPRGLVATLMEVAGINKVQLLLSVLSVKLCTAGDSSRWPIMRMMTNNGQLTV